MTIINTSIIYISENPLTILDHRNDIIEAVINNADAIKMYVSHQAFSIMTLTINHMRLQLHLFHLLINKT